MNLLITMLLGGLWHGASWNFVIWGGMHGGWLATERMANSIREQSRFHLPRRLRWMTINLRRILVFNGVCLTWVFFRSATLHDSLTIISRMFTWAPGADFIHDFGFLKCMLTISMGLVYFVLLAQTARQSTSLRWAASTIAVLLIVVFGAESKEFIYFVF